MVSAIKIENLSKSFQLGLTHAGSVRELVNRAAVGLFRGSNRKCETAASQADADGLFWALRDVSFEIPTGAAIGIIGRNGAGKSTLLKILTRITYPTSGRAELRGRVASLLEVGTGFHPELTGRENVHLNGTILGMTRNDILRRFDDIVQFAGVEKFIDTPVKRYSSGMTVRLGFAVAAHLEPEILIIDEVLAVGDVEFQQRCLGKMDEVANSGRTVVFVSHNMSTVRQLTAQSVVLDQGSVSYYGPTEQAIDVYIQANRAASSVSGYQGTRQTDGLGEIARFAGMRFLQEDCFFEIDQPLIMSLAVNSVSFDGLVRLSFTLFRGDGTAVGSVFSKECVQLQSGEETTTLVTMSDLSLAPGNYYFAISAGTGNNFTGCRDLDSLTDVLHFEVARPVLAGGGVAVWHKGWGPIRLPEPSLVPIVSPNSARTQEQTVQYG